MGVVISIRIIFLSFYLSPYSTYCMSKKYWHFILSICILKTYVLLSIAITTSLSDIFCLLEKSSLNPVLESLGPVKLVLETLPGNQWWGFGFWPDFESVPRTKGVCFKNSIKLIFEIIINAFFFYFILLVSGVPLMP